MPKKFGFTLLELLVVIIIIGILATLGFVNYTGVKEEALDKEAKANLKLVRAAERIYRMETTTGYIACADTAAANTTLKLSLPSGTNANWNYKVDVGGGGVPPAQFTAKARRTAGDNRTWCINQATEEPYASGCSW